MKKTLFLLPNSDESVKAKALFENRNDLTIFYLNEASEEAKKLHVTSAPTLVTEDWESISRFVGLEKIKEYLSNETTPKYACACSDVDYLK